MKITEDELFGISEYINEQTVPDRQPGDGITVMEYAERNGLTETQAYKRMETLRVKGLLTSKRVRFNGRNIVVFNKPE